MTAGDERAPVCVFAKPPVAGAVKTRLARTEGERRAADLARAFLVDTLTGLRAVPWARPILATTGPLGALAGPTPEWPQGDGDLGDRLERVLARALTEADQSFAIGADSPGLPRAHLERARELLVDADAVLGPADDGGFYLLGLRRCPPGLLHGLPWSTASTAFAVAARLRDAGLRVAHAPPWFDVDDAAALQRLAVGLRRGEVEARATRALLERPISIIIPTLDEGARIAGQVARVRELAGVREVIVVDGGSRDQTVARARAAGAEVLTATGGRGPQQNVGAGHARGAILLFLHADVELPADATERVQAALVDPTVVGGAFRTWTVATDRPWLAPLLHLADLRSRYTSLPYGDQALFARAATFARVGGFPPQPLFEDLELARRLRRYGRLLTVAASVRVSGRRFEARPLYWTAVVNLFPALYRLGVSADVLAWLYRPVR